MSSSDIFIFSQPVQTGKTTLLQQWVKDKKNIGGILTPDENGMRKLLNIATGEHFNLQLPEEKKGLKIGRFTFDEEVFATANEILIQTLSAGHDWIIIDEIGKLELYQNKGLAASASRLIHYFKTHGTDTKLLLIIRDYLLDDAIIHYQLHHAKILPASFFKNEQQEKLNGVVLCGGESSRMKADKAFIIYHEKSQWAHVSAMLFHFCETLFLSLNEKQSQQIDSSVDKIMDNSNYENAGPLTGLLSVLEKHPGNALFVVGCDYPYLQRSDLLQLFNERDEDKDAVCFLNDEHFAEPLIAIYELSCFKKLQRFYKEGGRSLQQFLKQINTKFIAAKNPQCLTSIDDATEMNAFKHAAKR